MTRAPAAAGKNTSVATVCWKLILGSNLNGSNLKPPHTGRLASKKSAL